MFKNHHKQADAFTFHHFNRKGWSLFCCLHRDLRIGVLSVATLTAATPRLAAASTMHAEGGDSLQAGASVADTLSLNEADITASRAPQAAGRTARQTVVLSRADIEAAGVTTINDVLKLAAGVDVRQRGGFGIQTDISIHGGTHDQICILLNGVPLVNPQTGHNAADFPVNLSDIERIELLEGAAARVAGSQAFSGVINVVTKGGSPASDSRPSPLEGGVETGSYATVRGDMRGARRLGKAWYVSVSGSGQRSDGAVANGDFKGAKSYGRAVYDTDACTIDLQTGVTVNDFGANTFYSAAYPDQWEALRRYLVSARAESKGRISLIARGSWLRNVDHFQLIRHSSTGENFHRSDVFTCTVEARTSWLLGTSSAGVELREEDIYSSNLGHALGADRYVPVRGEKKAFYTHHDNRTNLSCYLEHNAVWRRVSLSLGVMAERNSATDSRLRLYPGIDIAYRPAEAWRLYASFNRSMRLPSFTDLWYQSPTLEGNAGLRPEECTALSLGAAFRRRAVRLELKGHLQQGARMIDWVKYTPDDVFHATSFSLLNIGLDADAELDLAACLGTRQLLRRLSVSYAWLHQHRHAGEDFFKSNYALEYLRHKLTVRLNHRIVSRLSANWTLRLQQREGAWQVFDNGQPTAGLRPYGTHALLDCRLTWTMPRLSPYVDMTNLTATRYVDLANVRQPGFLMLGGLCFRL